MDARRPARKSKDMSRAKWALAVGVLSVSFPAILVRYADAPALVVAFWRKALAACILVPPALLQARRTPVKVFSGTTPLWGSLAGLFLALHFASWFVSLEMTTVASSVVLVCTGPIWTAVMGRLFLKERISRRGIAAIAISIAGVALIASGDWGVGPESLMGDLLAIFAAVFAAAYLTLGRHVKDRLPLMQWLLGVYAVCVVFLSLGILGTGTPFTGYGAVTWLMFLLLALIPSSLGHNMLNYAVRYMEAYKVNIGILTEPIISTVLAAILFAEMPGPWFYAGALLTLGGVWLALKAPAAEHLPSETANGCV